MSVNNPVMPLIPATTISEFNDHITKAIDLLLPFAPVLTPNQRKRMPKAKDKTLAFITKGLDYCEQQPAYLPAFYTPAQYKDVMDNLKALAVMQQLVGKVAGILGDTSLMNSSDAYKIALSYYDTTKQYAPNVPGAKEIYKDMSARFPRRKKKKPAPAAKSRQDLTIADNNTTEEAA